MTVMFGMTGVFGSPMMGLFVTGVVAFGIR